MKKIITTSVVLLLLISGCTNKYLTPVNDNNSRRIKLKETRIINGYGYNIIEVDGKEYLTQDGVGFIEITNK